MRDEISFRSLVVKSNNEAAEENQNIKNTNNQNEKTSSENDLNFFLDKQKSSASNLSSTINNNNSILNTQNKNDSKLNIVKMKIKEYFDKNKQLNKKDFNSFISFIGLSDIWSTEEQMFLWETIITKAKKEDNIEYEEALSCICEFFEYEEEDDEIIDKKSACFEKNSNSYLDVSQNENCIDEYLNSINNIKLLFGIKFINEIFLKNNLGYSNAHYSINTINTMNVNNSIANGINDDLDKSEGEVDNEVIQIDNKKTIIILSEIMNEIKNKYRFILVDYEELNTYLNNLNKNARKSEGMNNIIIKNEKKQEISLDKELINYVGAMIELKLEKKIKNEKNIESEDNNITNSNNEILNIVKEENNKISNDKLDNSDKKGSNKSINDKEKKEISVDKILEELNKLDEMISDSYEAIANFNKNKDLINLIKLFNENYIMNTKKILYDKINTLILENKKLLEQKNKREESEKKNSNKEVNQN